MSHEDRISAMKLANEIWLRKAATYTSFVGYFEHFLKRSDADGLSNMELFRLNLRKISRVMRLPDMRIDLSGQILLIE